ncbi:hypothetical protein OROHE_001269 [Orobanche hederae]
MVAAAGRFSPSPPAFPLSPRRFLVSDSLRKDPYHLLFASMTTNEDPIREWILSEGKATEITGTRASGGGCINRAYRYETGVGSFFVKTNRCIGPSMFEGEVLGLRAMYETRTIRVPQPFKFGPLPSGGSYIIMEFLESGASRGNQMHKAGKSTKGFGQRLVKNVRPLFDGAIYTRALLVTSHGDLWSGIYISYDKNGEPLILDPARLLLRTDTTNRSLECRVVLDSEDRDAETGRLGGERRDLYMLYHYTINLFGSGYRSSAMSITDDYLSQDFGSLA